MKRWKNGCALLRVKGWKDGFTSQRSNSSCHQLGLSSTHPLINSPSHQLVLSSTHPSVNSSSHQLVPPSTRTPFNSHSRQLVISSTRPTINSPFHQLVLPSTRRLEKCLFFSIKFNIVGTLVTHQAPIRPQKNDSREGWFWCKKGLVVNASKMNTHCIKPNWAPDFGPFAAKCSAFGC